MQLTTFVPDYVVFDLETTGISWKTDEVVEISALRVVKHRVVGEFSTLVNPGRPIPFEASRVNGITDEMVRDAPSFDSVLADFLTFAGNSVLVGHNIHAFDMKFIWRDSERYLGRQPENDYIDTLKLARAYLAKLPHHRLTDLAEHYGISIQGAHRALADCRMNQAVYECLRRDAEAAPEAKKCPLCGSMLQKRNGRYGMFLGCMGFPVCRYTENVERS